MGKVVKLTVGRMVRGQKLPKPVECKDCGDPIETKRLQVLASEMMPCTRCVSCQGIWDRGFARAMQGIGERQFVRVIR